MNDDKYDTKETEQRLQKALQGAFSGSPTPLKDIPTRSGESRKVQRLKISTSPTSPTQKPRRLKSKVRLHQIDDR
jgi:hypothetical protein